MLDVEANVSVAELLIKEMDPFVGLDPTVFSKVTTEKLTPEFVLFWRLYCQHLERAEVLICSFCHNTKG